MFCINWYGVDRLVLEWWGLHCYNFDIKYRASNILHNQLLHKTFEKYQIQKEWTSQSKTEQPQSRCTTPQVVRATSPSDGTMKNPRKCRPKKSNNPQIKPNRTPTTSQCTPSRNPSKKTESPPPSKSTTPLEENQASPSAELARIDGTKSFDSGENFLSWHRNWWREGRSTTWYEKASKFIKLSKTKSFDIKISISFEWNFERKALLPNLKIIQISFSFVQDEVEFSFESPFRIVQLDVLASPDLLIVVLSPQLQLISNTLFVYLSLENTQKNQVQRVVFRILFTFVLFHKVINFSPILLEQNCPILHQNRCLYIIYLTWCFLLYFNMTR